MLTKGENSGQFEVPDNCLHTLPCERREKRVRKISIWTVRERLRINYILHYLYWLIFSQMSTNSAWGKPRVFLKFCRCSQDACTELKVAWKVSDRAIKNNTDMLLYPKLSLIQFQLSWPSFITLPACLGIYLGGRLVVRLLLICALRAAYFSSEPTRGSFGFMIMTVLNRRVCRCHWKSINTFDAGAPPASPLLVACWPQSSVVLAQEKHQLHFQ